MRALLIDNIDSFTYNVADQLERLGARTQVVRCDEVVVADAIDSGVDLIVLSPGPGAPQEATRACELVRAAHAAGIPLFGVCLGMQCIAHVFGARVEPLGAVVHGRSTALDHTGAVPFRGASPRMLAGRYHSLAVDETTVPSTLEVTARTSCGTVMALRHRIAPIVGVQFHPESILTPDGDLVVGDILAFVRERQVAA